MAIWVYGGFLPESHFLSRAGWCHGGGEATFLTQEEVRRQGKQAWRVGLEWCPVG